jgi:hypothetical protein
MSAASKYVLHVSVSILMYLRLQTGSMNYVWYNNDRKSVQLPGPTYIDYVMTWVENLLNDPNTFPTKAGPSCSFLS